MTSNVWTKEEILFLEESYNKLSVEELEIATNRSKQAIYNKAHKMNLKSSYNNPEINEDSIIKLYKDEELQMDEIAKRMNVSVSLISKIIPNELKRSKKKIDSQEAIKMYQEGIGSKTIAKHFNVNASSVIKMLKKNNIIIRDGSHYFEEYRKDIPVNEVVDLYLYGFSSVEISEKYNVSGSIVLNRIREQGIDTRKDNSLYISGDKNKAWKGGTTNPNALIRGQKDYKHWRTAVFKRDIYTCQCCNDSKGGNLHAHHINNFSSNESERFDLTNGITLCESCHVFQKVGSFHHTYGAVNNDIQQLQEYFDEIRSELGLPLIKIEDIVYQIVKT